jgi:hypothetical protein
MAKQPKHGFKEYVKNPELFREESLKIASAASTPANEHELSLLVSQIGRRSLEYSEIQKLENAGAKIIPLLQAALRDEQVLFDRYALRLILSLLEPLRLPEAHILRAALIHSDEFLRKYALFHLARCRNDDAIEALVEGLKSPSEQCQSGTLMGLGSPRDSLWGSTRFRRALFPAVLALLDRTFGPLVNVPRVLLNLDFDRAKDILLAPNVFRPENQSIHKVLQALKESNVAVAVAELRDLLSGIKKKAIKYPFDYAYADGLILLARLGGSRSLDLISDAQSWGNEKIKEGAAIALMNAVGVMDAYGFAWDVYQRAGVEGLTEPQLYYLTLSWLDAEVRNGGFSQYYFNSSGELASFAVKAASAVGAAKLSDIIERANSLFGIDGPHPNRDQRMDQLSKIDLEALEALDSPYYKCPEKLNELLPAYAARNSQDFKAQIAFPNNG